ncbi:MAG: SGNH/GDSL hydrolase family protein [Solirubrobacterales bacterium]
MSRALPTAIVFALLACLGASPAAAETATGPPVVPEIGRAMAKRLSHELREARSHGNRVRVFEKVGDSISWSTSFLTGLACHPERLTRRYAYLDRTLRFVRRARFRPAYTEVYCGVADSFSRNSAATHAGTLSSWPTTPGSTYSAECRPTETPIGCETRVLRPAFAIVMLGTNDAAWRRPADMVTGYLSDIVTELRRRHVVPILETIPPHRNDPVAEQLVEEYNRGLIRLARERHLLLVNYWRALRRPNLLDGGLWIDGVHPNVAGVPASAVPLLCIPKCKPFDFSPHGLRYGYNLRNLVTLQTLHRALAVTGHLGPRRSSGRAP